MPPWFEPLAEFRMSELPTYYTNVNHTLLEALPRGAARVLEIGCGAGALGGRYLSAINKDCDYWGVEYVAEVAERAKGVLKTVLVGSIEDDAIYEQLPKDYFDVLVFGDVLEHLRDPWLVLRRLAQHMRPGGKCIACIPNTQHWSIFANLLNGSWEYQDSGLMDRTHLRFFTRKSMISMFDENGWKVVNQQPRIFQNEKAQRVVREILQTRDRLQLNGETDERDFLALQWVMTADVLKEEVQVPVKNEPGLKLNICAFTENFMDVRVRLPSRDLAKIDGVEVLDSVKQINIGEMRTFPGARVVIVQRPRILEKRVWIDLLLKLKKNDCILIYELDDHPDLLRTPEGVDRRFLAQSAAAVQTSTEKLQGFFSTVNRNALCFENSCHDLPVFRGEFFDEPPKVFYGALNRGAYSPELGRRISPILEKHGAACHVVADRAFFDSLTIRNKTFDPSLDYPAYLQAMRECQILLSPLEGLPGEEYKSDVKFIEASSQGLATIASALVYGETIVPGTTGLIADHMDEWPGKLDALLSSPQERRRLAFNAWNYVRTRRLFAVQAPLRVQSYLDLWQRREALWQEAADRVPELAKAFATGVAE